LNDQQRLTTKRTPRRPAPGGSRRAAVKPTASETDLAEQPGALDKRSRIVDAAARLAYEQGFGRTSLADIARESGVPLGNLYYYFKTKDAIGEALIEKMSAAHGALRAMWDAALEPRERIEAFVQAAIDGRETVARRGCSIGTLCVELHKEPGPLAERASMLFYGFLKWLETQFRLLGKGAESRELAFHLVSALQGASLLANTFHDTRQITRECTRLKEWIRSL
jgi:TetR/AcrR family transcriptional repressor of nem operon